MGEGGVKNPEKMPTSFMDGPLMYQTVYFTLLHYISIKSMSERKKKWNWAGRGCTECWGFATIKPN